MTLEIADLFADRESERYTLHARHLNEQMVRMLKTIGFDEAYRRASGQHLYDRDGERYLDLLSGRGVFAIGRNHPTVRDTLKKVLDSDLPNLVQMGVSALAGLLAERLLRYVPCLDKVFFANSGTEPVEAALKFARSATGRTGILYCDHAFHGLSYGSLSGDTALQSRAVEPRHRANCSTRSPPSRAAPRSSASRTDFSRTGNWNGLRKIGNCDCADCTTSL
jgi:ornithine--oxo-acid transaminase